MLIEFQGWQNAGPGLKLEAEQYFGCCGFKNFSEGVSCDQVEECKGSNETTTTCPTCEEAIQDKIDYAFNAAGGLGLFFSFTEVRDERNHRGQIIPIPL